MTNASCRRIPLVIAETEELKANLVRVTVGSRPTDTGCGLGLDHRLFRPMEQQPARDALGISHDAIVVLYVGGIDEYHDLEPVIEALAELKGGTTELHVVGNGE